jgi:polygalacturonase
LTPGASRRDFVRTTLAAGAGLALLGCVTTSGDPWTLAPIRPRIRRGDFPIASGNEIQKAVEACHAAGGGRVVIPAGDFLTGPIHLRSGVELHLQAGATLRFNQDPNAYPLTFTRWEGVELMNYSPLVYAFDCDNVAVTGEGTLDGQGDETHWWNWKAGPQLPDRTVLFKQAEDGVPVEQRRFGAGHFLRPTFIEPYRCRNVLIEGVTIRNAPFWVMHPTLCNDVTVRNVKVISHGPNNDGCDPESSKNVLIEDCQFDTGDDCIALKSGRNADGRRLHTPVENVLIRRCEMKDGHGGITVGSEISGGARNIYAEKCKLDSPNLERGLRLKTNTARGGVIENVHVRDIEIGTVQLAPIEIDLRYDVTEPAGSFIPTVRNVVVERMHSAKSRHGLYIRGLEQAPVRGVIVRDSVFRGVAEGHVIEGAVDVRLEGLTVEAAPPAPKGKGKP